MLEPLLAGTDTFVEPFVGGGSTAIRVALARRDIRIVLSDKNPYIAAFWLVLRCPREVEQLCDMISKCEPTVDLWERNRELMERPELPDRVERAFSGLFDNRTSRGGFQTGGVMGGKGQLRGTIRQRWNATELVARVKALHDLFYGRLIVRCADACGVIAEFADATKYCDPPYVKDAHKLYRHAFTEADHQRLADELRRQKMWVLSYNDVALIRELYAWANVQTLTVRYCNHRKHGHWDHVTELLIQPPSR